MEIKKSFVFFLLSLCIQSIWAQKQYKYFQFTTEDGLPCNTIYSITEDKNGNIILGTDNGLTVYNGINFQTYNIKDGLVNPYIVSVCKAKDNKIWMLAYNDMVQIFDGKKIKRTNIQALYFNHLTLSEDNVFLYNPQRRTKNNNNYVQKKLYLKNFNPDLTNDDPNYLLAQPVLVQNNKKIKLIGRNLVYEGKTIPIPNDVNLIYKVIFRKNDVCILDEKYFYELDFKGKVENRITLPHNLSSNVFQKVEMVLDQHENCWLNIQGHGLYVIKEQGCRNIISDLGLLPDENINEMYCDSRGQMWIATHQNGLFCIPKITVENFKFEKGQNYFTEFLTDEQNNQLFLATPFDLYSYKNNQISHLQKTKIPIRLLNFNDKIHYYYNFPPKEKQYQQIQNLPRIYGKQVIKSTPYGYYSLWGLNEIIFHSYNTPNEAGVIIHSENNAPIGSEKFRNIIEYKNQYYFNDYKSISIKTFNTGKIHTVRPLKFNPKGYIEDFKFINDTMWIAASNKIYRLHNEKLIDSISTINEKPLDVIRKICLINDDIYLCCANGLYRISKKGNRVLNLYNYLPNNDVYNVTLFQNHLFVATIDGIAKIPKHLINEKSAKPTFNISNQWLHNNKIILENEINTVQLTLKIQNFNGLKNQIIQFKSDNSYWIPIENRHDIFIPMIEYGNNTVTIRVRDVNSDWETKTINIYRQYPTYMQWWFILFCLLFIVVLIIIYSQLQIKKIRIKKQKEIAVNNKMVELRQNALSAMMNPHFLFNSLNAIQYFINSNQKALSSDYLGKLARLVRMFLMHSSQPYIQLDEEIDRLKLYVELEQVRFNNFVFDLQIDPNIDLKNTKIPNMIIQPFIENAVIHGISHLQTDDGKISLKFNLTQPNVLSIIICDNGYGYDPKAAKRSNHVSKGVQIITERLEILQQANPHKTFQLFSQDCCSNQERKGYAVHLSISI